MIKKNTARKVLPAIRQQTISKEIHITGIGLHSGQKVTLTMHPAEIDTGVIFRRVDVEPVVSIPAKWDRVGDTRLCTTLQSQNEKNVKIATVEHLMSALYGLGIDNVIVDVDAPELPILDGSSAPFVFLIQSAGISKQKAPKRFIRITKPVCLEDKDKYVKFIPYDGYKVSCTIEFNHPLFNGKPQSAVFDSASTSYARQICKARTFAFQKDYEELLKMGLAQGGSMDNAIVVGDYKVLNEEGLRFDGEFAAHKVLDAMGDLYLLGSPLIGAFEGYKSGHELNNKILRALMARQDAWEYVSSDAQEPVFSELQFESGLLEVPA